MRVGAKRRFGSNKYIALGLMMARWLRCHTSTTETFRYVTLGGTDLHDVLLLCWINGGLFSHIISYEYVGERYALARTSAEKLAAKGINVEVVEGDVFEYERAWPERHVFFLDLEGTCNPTPFTERFRDWFSTDTIRVGDLLLITSYLGRNPGWHKVLTAFDQELRLLRVEATPTKKIVYQIAHPLFIIYRALSRCGLQGDIRLDCLGHIKYRDTSLMGVYGIALVEGQTRFRDFISQIPVLDLTIRQWGEMAFR